MNSKPTCEELEQKILALEMKIFEIQDREEKLRESEKKFRELTEYLPETIFELDMQFNLTIVNRRAFDLFGYAQEEINKGLNALDLLAPDDRQRAAETLQRILRGEQFGLNDYTAVKKDGSVFPVMIHSTMIRDQGRPVGIRGFVVDVSEKKKIEAQLRQVQRMESIGVLAGGIAHDFNNILSIIIGNIDLVLDKAPEEDPARDRLQTAIDACFRARDVANQLVTFSRSKQKDRFPLKINFMVKESLRLLSAIIPKNIKITQNVRFESGKVLSDPVQISQLIINLCMNSIHAMEENGGTLDVSLMNVEVDEQSGSELQLAKGGRYVNLTVKDTGVGIDPKIQDRIFEPYFTTKKIGKGSGMGLSVVYGIVKDHGGRIKVDSAPGKGTAINIFFPIIEDEPKTETRKAVFDSKKANTILLVDDEELIVEVACLLLEKLGYEVKSTTSPIEALEIFKSAPGLIGLVITDASMPKMGGEELIRNILSIRPNTPIIMCTGNSGIVTAEEARKIGASSFIRKPFKKVDMIRAIQEALAA